MSPSPLILLGLLIGLSLSLAVVLAIRRSFFKLLRELSPSEARAHFWGTVGLLGVLLIGLQASLPTYGVIAAATGRYPWLGPTLQTRYALLGLLACLVVIALLVVSAINRYESLRAAHAIPWEDAPTPEPQVV